jgi:hypothetical protein
MRPCTNCGNIELLGFVAWSIRAMKNLDLINWTIQEAEHLKTERREPGGADGATSLDKLFAVLEREPVGQACPEDPVAQIAGALRFQIAAGGQTGQPSSVVVDVPPRTDVISNLPASTQPAPSTPTDGWVEAQMPELLKAMSNLHKAIVDPDIATATGDRDRAIALRWVLRDIKSNRLKWSPVNHQDLRILIIMGLVEMRDDAPVLTNAGFSAVV